MQFIFVDRNESSSLLHADPQQQTGVCPAPGESGRQGPGGFQAGRVAVQVATDHGRGLAPLCFQYGFSRSRFSLSLSVNKYVMIAVSLVPT